MSGRGDDSTVPRLGTSRRHRIRRISPTEIGTRGNSHMIMQDKNHLQVADLILKWIDERVGKPGGRQEMKNASATRTGRV